MPPHARLAILCGTSTTRSVLGNVHTRKGSPPHLSNWDITIGDTTEPDFRPSSGDDQAWFTGPHSNRQQNGGEAAEMAYLTQPKDTSRKL